MEHLLTEAQRCIKCKNPKCQKHCPIGTPIPEIISLFEQDKIHEAGQILFNNNPLSAVCALVCIHETQCNGNCIVGIKGKPVNFHEIEHYISEQYLQELVIEKAPANHHKVAIVGTGPAGITAAILLAQKGYYVTMFEMRSRIGGVLTYGIPEFRLPRATVNHLEAKLYQLGVKIKPNTLVGPVITLDKLLSDGFDAIFIGTGVWNPKTLNIKGETLGNAIYAIDYLKEPKAQHLGKRIAVIGAGNVAMDAARTAKMNGSEEVHIFYRSGHDDMTASKTEIRETEEDGILFHFHKSPIEINEEGVFFMETEKFTREDGHLDFKTIAGTEEFFTCDNVIIAVSQSPKSNIVSTSPELNTRYGLIVADSNGTTTKRGVFACGDVVSGARTVIEAVMAAKIVSNTIDQYCQTL